MNPPAAIQAISQTCTQVAQELVQQREFFEYHREELPACERELPSARMDVQRYNGDRSTDEQLNLRVGAMRMLGFSDRAIERECGIDRRTIPHRLEWLSRAGRIPAQKDRLLRVVGESAEKSGLLLNDLLDRARVTPADSDLAAMIRSVATAHGIAVEKVQLLTGAPTEIIEIVVGAGRSEIEEFWRSAGVVEVEPSSTDMTQITTGFTVDDASGYGSDTSPPAPAAPTGAGEGGRGGSESAPGVEKVNGLEGSQICLQGGNP